MSKKRRSFSDEFKAKVALEAIKGHKTLAELSVEFQVHPNQISEWKKLLLESAADLFGSKKAASLKSPEEQMKPLFEEIGRLKMDIRWLEKKL